MVHLDEIKCLLEEKACENQKTLEAIYTMERENQWVKTDNHVHYEGNKGTFSWNPFDGNDVNHMPWRTPRVTARTFPSPPRPSHHDSDEEVTSEDVIKFQQDGFAQKLMLRALKENGDQYFWYMVARGWKIPQGFDVECIIHKWEPTEAKILREEMQELRKQFTQL